MRRHMKFPLIPIAIASVLAEAAGCTTSVQPITASGGDATTSPLPDAATSPPPDGTTSPLPDAATSPLPEAAISPPPDATTSLLPDAATSPRLEAGSEAAASTTEAGIMDSGVSDASSEGVIGECGSNSIAFELLTVDAGGPVYYTGSGWPSPEWSCPFWLAIAPAGESPVTIFRDTCNSCGPVMPPESAGPMSFTWDGTYYLVPSQLGASPSPSDASCIGPCCEMPFCASPGDYVATMCVGYASDDAAPPGTYPPTCKQIPFVWPPTSANESIVLSITPTPDGG